MVSTKIKICGLMSRDDVMAANEVHPDYIGFVFAKSSRMICEDLAQKLKKELDPSILSVGVFVNQEHDMIIHLCKQGIIDIVQLHGDEEEDFILSLRREISNPIIKAVRVRNVLDISTATKFSCDYLLLDAYKENEYGGSGCRFDWSLIPEMKKPFFLAGGINSSNVLQAVQQFNPYCIDVSSGVETDGRKDIGKMTELISKIRSVK
ncbi:MAG TPA: phosphoribosylanthranilate isomerase [Mobilitalea sp.]|nr:phosphoribosylanthranilate isomerase [Mobilitalea sp.]